MYHIIAENSMEKLRINGKTFVSKEAAKKYYDKLPTVPDYDYDVYIENVNDFLDKEYIQKAYYH